MIYTFVRLFSIAAIVAPALSPMPCAAVQVFDVVVYGGTSAGIVAAIQAKRMGKNVALVEPSNHLGGLTTGGLGATDIGNKQAIGGLARDFYRRIWRHYQNDAAWTRETRDAHNARNPRHNPNDETMWTFEPHVASQVYREMLAEADIEPIMNERLDRANGVGKQGPRIMWIKTESGRTFVGRMFIDATYEGDLMAAAGVAYHVGREANDVYGETLNGVQPKLNVKNHRFTQAGRSVRAAGRSGVGAVVGHSNEEPRRPMAAATAACRPIASACARPTYQKIAAPGRSRPTTTSRATNSCCATSKRATSRAPWHPLWMPNRKTDTNNNGAFSTDYIGGERQVSRGQLRRAREDRRRSHLLPAGPAVDAGQSPARAANECGPSSSGWASRRMNSSRTTTGRRNCTSAKRGA